MRAILALAIPAVLLLSSCSSSGPSISNPITGGSGPRPPADVPLFGGGFRSEGDQCRRAGESAFTNQFLGGGTYLVACPPGTDTATFTAQTRGREVSRRDGWILFTVPH